MKKIVIVSAVLLGAFLALQGVAYAHDGWVQTNVPRANVGDMVYVDMQFGNHGNMHRDYKIYPSKWDITKATFTLHSPSNEMIDLKDNVTDIGKDEVKTFANGTITYTDKNGYLVTSFIAKQLGIYIVDVRQDVVVSYAPERSIKCTKAVVGATPASTRSNARLIGYDKVLGQVLEIVPLKDPTSLAIGDTLPFEVLFKGEPLPDAEVTVIPRGKVLPEMGTPNPYDFMTDEEGEASFTFTEANYHLIVVHVHTEESGELDGKQYSFTKYAAALTVIVSPQRQPSNTINLTAVGSITSMIVLGLAVATPKLLRKK